MQGDRTEKIVYLIHSVEPESPWTGPFYFRAPRLGPRAFSVSVVDSLKGSFVWGRHLYSRANFKLNLAAAIAEWRQRHCQTKRA